MLFSDPTRFTRGRDRKKYMVAEEVRRLIAATKADANKASNKYYVMWCLLAGTGIRITAALNIRPCDFWMSAEGIPFLRVKWLKKLKPEFKVHEMEISTGLYNLLKRWSRHRSKSKPIFDCKRRVVSKMIKKYLALAGLPNYYSPKALRHYHLNDFAKKVEDIREVFFRAGHCRLETTMIYQHTNPEKVARILDEMPCFV